MEKKIKINELKYIVMEGGGARGTAYLGAIKALEDQLIELVKNDIYKIYLTKSNETQKSIDKKAILNVISAMVKSYKNNKATSWLKKKSILTIALEGYSFGAERAQVRDIGDNNHIIPLYSYGVGTFDFNLKKVNPMSKLAQAEAEKDVNKYFRDNNQQKN